MGLKVVKVGLQTTIYMTSTTFIRHYLCLWRLVLKQLYLINLTAVIWVVLSPTIITFILIPGLIWANQLFFIQRWSRDRTITCTQLLLSLAFCRGLGYLGGFLAFVLLHGSWCLLEVLGVGRGFWLTDWFRHFSWLELGIFLVLGALYLTWILWRYVL